MKTIKILLLCFLFLILFSITNVYTSFADSSGSITLKFVSDKGINVSGIGVLIEGKSYGATDVNGNIFISPISLGLHDMTIVSSDERIDGAVNGVNVKKENDSDTVFIDVCIKPGSNTTGQSTPQNNQSSTEKITLAQSTDSKRDIKIDVSFDNTVPPKSQEYINKLINDIDPVIRRVVGVPIQNGKLTLTYDPTQHLGFKKNNAILLMSKLPNVDKGIDMNWDDWFTINYIHMYLQGRSIPVPGTRYNENLAHPIKTIVLNYLYQEGIRKSDQKSIEYYVKAYNAFESMGPDILLNQGNTDNVNEAFNSNDFGWENDSYEKMNAFTLEYAKALWLKLYNERYLETGKNDFFIEFQNEMYEKNPQTAEQFYNMMDGIINNINGLKGGEWIKGTSGFAGKIDEPLVAKALITKGNYWNIEGINDPNYIYPFVISRTPARIMNVDAEVKILDISGKELYSERLKTGFNNNGLPFGVEIPDGILKPGKYNAQIKCVVNGKEITSNQEFSVKDVDVYNSGNYTLKMPDTKPIIRNTKVTITYDNSVPENVRNYINKLVNDIDPVIRGFVGDPIQNESLIFQNDPNAIQGMNRDMTILNTRNLPVVNGNNPDRNFDSFFFIEYYHMFNKGRSIPIEELRYTENISQAMKIVIGNYLNQNNIRETSISTMNYYLNLFDVLDTLGPGILVNNGATNGNPESTEKLKNKWDGNSKYMQLMNVFTLNYSPTLWLKLADAEYKNTGEYDFFMKLQDALYTSQLNSVDDFYRLIDRIVSTEVDGKKASDWLKNTGLLKGMSEDNVFVRPLPVKGNWFNMNSIDDPDYIFPFVVDRSQTAKIVDDMVKISIVDSNDKEVYSENFKPGITSNGEYLGMLVPIYKLSRGEYYTVVTATIDGKEISGKQTFKITTDNTPVQQSSTNNSNEQTTSSTADDKKAEVVQPQNNNVSKDVIPEKLSAAKNPITLKKGQKLKFPTIKLLSNGKQTDVTKKMKWNLKNHKTAAIKNNSLILGISKGNTILYGRYRNLIINIMINVK